MSLEIIDDLKYEDKLLARSILDGATYFYENSVLCDVILIIEDKRIEAHKCILAAASLYFRGMFCAGLKETGQREITIHDVDYKAMESVVRFFYSSSIILTEDNIFDVIGVVDLLGVVSLHSACVAFLKRSITVRNCAAVYAMSQLHGYADVAQDAVGIACRHFNYLMEMEEFLDMPVDMLQSCLANKMLSVCSENALLNRLCAWVAYNVVQRGDSLSNLLDQLNVYTLDLVAAEASLYQLTSLQAQACKWLERARHLRERGITLTNRNRQRYSTQQQVVLSCGGLTGSAIANVEALTVHDSMWRCMVPSPSQAHGFRVVPPLRVPRIYTACTYTPDHVYVIGGRNNSGVLSSVERYSVEVNEWEECPTLPEPLEGAAACVSDGCVYISGGFNTSVGVTNKTWVLEHGHRSWKALPSMTHCRSHHGLLAVHGYIYAIAGAGVDGELLASVERLNVRSPQWQPVASLQIPRSHFGAVAFESSLYVLGGLDAKKQPLRSVQVYDTLTQEWAADQPMSVGRHSHGATVAKGKIYIAAGTDGVHQLATCDVFNPHTHLWHCKPSLARPRVGQAMATITVPTSPPPNI